MPDPQQMPWQKKYKIPGAPPVAPKDTSASATPSGGAMPWEKKYAQPKAKATSSQTAPPKVNMEKEHPFYSGVAEGSGLDPQKIHDYGGLEASREAMVGLGNTMTAVIHDPFKVADIISGMATQFEKGSSELVKGAWNGDTRAMQHGAGATLASLGQILGGAEGAEKIKGLATTVDGATKAAADIAQRTGKDVGEATRVAHRSTVSEVPNRLLKRKAFEDMYVHAKGLEIGQKVAKASEEVNKEIRTHSDGIASKIDTAIPSGVIDATDAGKTVMDNFIDVVKTPETAHPALRQMVADAQATAPGQWTWEKVRQFRSSIGRAINKVQGPQEAVLAKTYKDLTTRLSDSAKKYGLGKEWDHYNELSAKYHQKFGDLIEDVTTSKSGHQVAAKLQANKALTIEALKNLSKYDLDLKDTMKYMKDSKRILDDSGKFRGLFRAAYGTPFGIAATVGGGAAGFGMRGSLIAGAGVGLLSSYLINLARTMKLSPAVVEHMLESRELPGRMKFGGGDFGPTGLTAPDRGGFQDLGGVRGGPSGSPGGAGDTPRGQLPLGPPNQLGRGAPSQLPPPRRPQLPPPTAPQEPKVTKVPEGEVGREPGKRAGTTKESKLARQAKARERVAAKRAEQGATALGGGGKTLSGGGAGSEAIHAQEMKEAQRRATAPRTDVSNLQIPEMEEALQRMDPEEFKDLQEGRKKGKWSDQEYIEGLKYLILEAYEKGQK